MNEVRLVVPPGTTDARHRLRLTICDPVVPNLCSTNETSMITVGVPAAAVPTGSTGPAPGALQVGQGNLKQGASTIGGQFRTLVIPVANGLRTSLRIRGAHSKVSMGRVLVTGRAGATLRALSGRVTGPELIPGLVVTLRDPAGKPVTQARVDTDGRWHVGPVKLKTPGVWTITIGDGPEVRRLNRFTVILTPTVTVRTSLLHRVLRVAGVLDPRVSGKQVVLEWRPAGGGVWSPAAIGRTLPGGRLALFGNAGIAGAVRMRVTSPAERGVPLAGGVSRVFTPGTG